MKIFNWMRNKLNGKENFNKPSESIRHHENKFCKEEFSDWPNTLLAIGTFGNSNLKEQDKSKIQGNLPAKQDPLENATSQEFAETDQVLRQLADSAFSGESEKQNLLLDKLLLDIVPKDVLINHVQGNKDICMDKKSKKWLTFLLKKLLLCSGGFGPGPGPMLSGPLPLPEHKLEKSRMEKILRVMLHKKIYPQRPNPEATTKKYLDKPETDDDSDEEEYDKSKWDKTDSEYIVLEI